MRKADGSRDQKHGVMVDVWPVSWAHSSYQN